MKMYISMDKDYLAEKLNIPSHLEIEEVVMDEVEGMEPTNQITFLLRKKK